MRRAVVQVLRTARRTSVWRFLPSTQPLAASAKQSRSFVGFRPASTDSKNHGPLQILQSAMYLRQFSVAAVVSVVASGVWYYRATPNQQGDLAFNPTPSNDARSSTRSAFYQRLCML